MLQKFTDGVKKVVGAGVIAVASLASQDANAGLKRMDYEPLTTQTLEEKAAYKDSVKVSLQKKFEADLKAKGLHSITLNFVESSINGVPTVTVSGSIIESVVDASLVGESKLVNKEVGGFGVAVSKETFANKYMLEEELSKVIKETIDSISSSVK